MLKIRIIWHNLQDCLKYFEKARSHGTLFKLSDVNNSFFEKNFYSCELFFSNEESFKEFCIRENIKDFEYL